MMSTLPVLGLDEVVAGMALRMTPGLVQGLDDVFTWQSRLPLQSRLDW